MKSSELRLGEYIFDKDEMCLVRSGGQAVNLRHKSREVLKLLAEKPGDTVLKREFFETVWDNALVSEESLAKCVADIRKAIGDHDKLLIETIPRKGYRLVVRSDTGHVRSKLKYAAVATLILAVGLVSLLVGQPWVSKKGPPIVAVLPFKDLSSEPHRGYLSDAVSEGIIVDLARFPELTIIAESSSLQFRDKPIDIKSAAAALGADFLLDGSQQFNGTTLRITAQLINVETGVNVWSDTVDADLGEVFEINQALSRRVANSVAETVADIEFEGRSTQEADAMFRYSKAHNLLLQGLSRDNTAKVHALNIENLEAHPDVSWSHIAMAFSLRLMVRFDWTEGPSSEALAKARNHAQRAVELDPNNYLAHFALGRVLMQGGDQDRAVQELEKAAELNPSSAHTLNALAQPYFYLGRTDDALKVLAKAKEIDPLPSFVHHWMKGWALWQDGQCEAALASLNGIPDLPAEAYKLLAVIHICRGDVGAANDALSSFELQYSDWRISEERELHASVWLHEPSLDRWLAQLGTAGMPYE